MPGIAPGKTAFFADFRNKTNFLLFPIPLNALPLPFLSSPPPETQTALTSLLATVLETTEAEVAADLRYQQQRQPVQAWLAVDDNDQPVGCKLGYERKPGHYYSWLGGVLPNHQGQGVATELMCRQHVWCQTQGYGWVRTHTYNQWRGMLLLNLRQGFDIIGTVQGAHGLLIVLEKRLRPAA